MKKSIFIGFLAGIVSGFFGAGGGMLLVPYMTEILKIKEVKSRATAIFCIFFIVITSSMFYFAQKSIDWKITLYSAIGRNNWFIHRFKAFDKIKI